MSLSILNFGLCTVIMTSLLFTHSDCRLNLSSLFAFYLQNVLRSNNGKTNTLLHRFQQAVCRAVRAVATAPVGAVPRPAVGPAPRPPGQRWPEAVFLRPSPGQPCALLASRSWRRRALWAQRLLSLACPGFFNVRASLKIYRL